MVRNAEHAALHRGRGGDIPKTLNPYARGDHYPYTAPNAHEAKILHFNGEVKPWRMSSSTLARATPGEGALCLWADLSAGTVASAAAAQAAGNPNRRPVAADAPPCAARDVRDCLTSCAREWHKYVDGIGLPRDRVGP